MTRTPIVMPNLGYDQPSGRILAWAVSVGERVERGDLLLQIETDKATLDVQALTHGTLAETLHVSGDDVPVGQTIGFLDVD